MTTWDDIWDVETRCARYQQIVNDAPKTGLVWHFDYECNYYFNTIEGQQLVAHYKRIIEECDRTLARLKSKC